MLRQRQQKNRNRETINLASTNGSNLPLPSTPNIYTRRVLNGPPGLSLPSTSQRVASTTGFGEAINASIDRNRIEQFLRRELGSDQFSQPLPVYTPGPPSYESIFIDYGKHSKAFKSSLKAIRVWGDLCPSSVKFIMGLPSLSRYIETYVFKENQVC